MATAVTLSEPSTGATQTIEAFLCDNCRCPIGSLWDVLPAEAHASAWRDQVYSYELDLFSNGTPPIQAYSATNPSKRRFDLLRLAPHVTVHHHISTLSLGDKLTTTEDTNRGGEMSADPATNFVSASPSTKANSTASLNAQETTATDTTTTTHAPPFVECETTAYSSEHSFFTGYAWCFCHCSNCGAFLGWGFASEERLRTAASARAHACEEGKERGDTVAASGSSATQDRSDNDAHTPLIARPRVDAAQEDHHGDDGEQGGTGAGLATASALPTAAAAASSPMSTCTPPVTPVDEGAEEQEGGSSWVDDGDETADSNDEEVEDEEIESGRDVKDAAGCATSVAPDFIAIIITNCTGEPNYSVESLLHEIEWRPWRLQRRRRVQALSQELRRRLLADADGFHAHRIYYTFQSIVGRMFLTPPAALHPVVGEDDVPQQLLEVLEEAHAAVAPQREHAVRGGEVEDRSSGDVGENRENSEVEAPAEGYQGTESSQR